MMHVRLLLIGLHGCGIHAADEDNNTAPRTCTAVACKRVSKCGDFSACQNGELCMRREAGRKFKCGANTL